MADPVTDPAEKKVADPVFDPALYGPLDVRVRNHLALVSVLADEAADTLDAHVESARAAFKAKDASAHEAAMTAIAEHPKKMREKVKSKHDAIVAGAPTAT